MSDNADGSALRVLVRTLRDVGEGEELTLSYIDLLQPKESRQRSLVELYGFECECSRCESESVVDAGRLNEIAETHLTGSDSVMLRLNRGFIFYNACCQSFGLSCAYTDSCVYGQVVAVEQEPVPFSILQLEVPFLGPVTTRPPTGAVMFSAFGNTKPSLF